MFKGELSKVSGTVKTRSYQFGSVPSTLRMMIPASSPGPVRNLQKQPRNVLVLVLATAAVAFLALPNIAQVDGPSNTSRHANPQFPKPIQVDVEMVLVNVTVTDLDGRPMTGLQKDNFQLFENNVEQEILDFSHEDSPISIGLIFDTSGSMADKIDKTRQAVVQILKTANPQDEFFLVSFASRAKLTSGFTSDIAELQSRMTSQKPKGSTALLDAIHLGMKQMKNARYRRRALVVISDGGDNHSLHSESRIRKELKEADCQLYAIGIYDRQDMKLTVEERNGPKLLFEMAETTGGRAFPVSSLDELPDISATLSMELRDQYVLGYKPDKTSHDGTWRNVKVKVLHSASQGSLRVYARNGYYKPSE
jgi:Ca-activated chloride channel family protein